MIEYGQKPEDFTILFLDMDAFFASVEQQVQPNLREKPVGVAPYIGNTGCVIAKSQQAKIYGVKTGCSVEQAKAICPQIKIVQSRPALYYFYHQQIIKILESHSPFLKILSIDEFKITLTGPDQNFKTALQMAKAIKQDITEKVGDYLTCSVGIGPNLFLAKVAAESKKPNTIAIVKLKDLASFYQGLKLTDLTGINSKMAANLKNIGIATPFAFYSKTLPQLSRFLGHLGKVWFLQLRGYEIEQAYSATKTLGHSHVLAPQFRQYYQARKVLVKLCQKVAARLRTGGFAAGGVCLTARFLENKPYHSGWQKVMKTAAFSDSQTLLSHALKLFQQIAKNKKILYLSVTTFNLTQGRGVQISLFANFEKSKAVSEALDKITDRFGAQAVFPASMSGAQSSAPDRIPFGQPRYDIKNQ